MENPTTLLPLLFFLLATGALAGVMAGLLGVGGGIVLVPAYFYLFSSLGYAGGQVMQLCLGTSLATIVVTSIRSLHAHNRKGAVDWSVLKSWSIGIAIGAIIGGFTATALSSNVLQAVFGVLGVVVGWYIGFGKQNWQIAEALPRGIKRAFISPILGFLSVLMGIGGGSLGVPLMSLHGVAIHRAVATAAGFGLAISLPALPGFLSVYILAEVRPPLTIGAINLPAFAITIAMTLITAPYGARLAHTMDAKPLKRVFAVFLTLVALNMLRKAFVF
ncbi:sulfite exporter TauE/SafE family protein [Oceanibium sediminis]|uniref:sulfite exporter TauE/SafE family protein n=1 Tax=Oceanibium sediminis TaxID=2026339 RepID=UPI000DD30410|nr:sulfite exporter TauE/SafE family protein [Oceanibium sediminis]